MKRQLSDFSGLYQAALRNHLRGRVKPVNGLRAKSLGRQAMVIGLETLDLARIHEQALISLLLPDCSAVTRDRTVRRAGTFFAEAINPIEKTHHVAKEINLRMAQLGQKLLQRSTALAASNRLLKREIAQRKSAEQSLRQSEVHYGRSLQHSREMQEQLRLLSRQLLSAQEEERKKISRELHDVIAQTLTNINIRLAALKKEATFNTQGLDQSIARTQHLVQQSVDIVHRFARELRPTVLDDLGLIPALHTFMKSFRETTGISVSLSAMAAVEEMSSEKRTVLYRVAQEAMNNVARHARASRVNVKIEQRGAVVHMKIKDDGKGFPAEHIMRSKRNKRLGLLGMIERVEMVGGSFAVTSLPGKGTTVLAQVPLKHLAGGGKRRAPLANPNSD